MDGMIQLYVKSQPSLDKVSPRVSPAEYRFMSASAGVPETTKQHVHDVLEKHSSAFCTYFMDHEPRDWHDILEHHDFEFDKTYRDACVRSGVYHLPLVCKQSSISYAHTEQILADVLDKTRRVLKSL
ncbi:MAG: hypothetical protein AAF720_11135 [Pseudomonadota bacterium]